MKHNLETILQAIQQIKDDSAETRAYQMSLETEDWKALLKEVEGFEKELRQKRQDKINLTDGCGICYKCEQALAIARFIEEEVLGETT